MIGTVDDERRALLSITVSDRSDGTYTLVTTWIDTAFDGHLVFPKDLIQQLHLESLVETEAILADGSKVTLDTLLCFVDWFGNRIPLHVIENEGRFPLLGMGLLANRVLHIDCAKNDLRLD